MNLERATDWIAFAFAVALMLVFLVVFVLFVVWPAMEATP